MKKLFFSLFFIAGFICTAMAQQAWNNYYTSREVRINYQSVECHDVPNGVHKRVTIFQFQNLTDRNLTITFDKQMWYNNGKCIGCTPTPEQHFTVNLAPKQTLQGTCEDKNARALYIVQAMLNTTPGASLTKFELANLIITSTNR